MWSRFADIDIANGSLFISGITVHAVFTWVQSGSDNTTDRFAKHMSIFTTFKHDGVCDRCSLTFPKDKLNALDSTLDSERKKGEVLWLCRSCLIPELQTYIRQYRHRAVMVHPIGGKWNAYQFYTFPRMIQLYGFNKKWVDDIKSFLPATNAKCQGCGSPAHFNWCDSAIYSSEPFPESVNLGGAFKQEILCGDCVGRKVAEIIYEKDLRFDDIWPPVDADGFCTSWEY